MSPAPLAAEHRISADDRRRGDGLAVDGDAERVRPGLRHGVKAAVHHAASTPGWDSDADVEGCRPFGIDGQPNVAIPRVIRRLGEGEPLPLLAFKTDLCARPDEEVDVQAVGVRRVDVPRQRPHELQEHRRAAWAGVPGPSRAVPSGVQWVFVEVSVAFQRDAGECAVVERAFQLVDLRGVGRGEEQVVVEESARDGGAGFEVTVVRQDEVAAELLVSRDRADATGDVKAAGDHVPPEALGRFDVLGLRARNTERRDARGEKRGSHGVPFDGRLLEHRQVVLAVFAEVLSALMVASSIDPEAREVEVAPLVDPHAQVSLELEDAP